MSRRTDDLPQELRPLVACGATFIQKTGEEYVFVPPWDHERKGKLYARVKDGGMVYSDKRGDDGNTSTFLGKVFDAVYRPALTMPRRCEFTRSLGLPPPAANGIDLGYDESRNAVVLAVRSRTGHVWDLRRLIDGQWQSTAGCKLQLLWAERLHAAAGQAGQRWVYVAEGEKDAIALRWRLRTLGIDAVVVAVPGAKNLNEKWVSLFKGHHVRLCHDNDKAGREGSAKAVRLLRGVAAKLEVLHWPDNIRDGYDVRDWITYGIEHEVAPADSWAGFEKMFGPPIEVEDDKPLRFKLLTVAEIEAEKPPEFTIDRFLQQRSNTVIYAPPGVGKSFFAMSWAGSIAAGVPWLGRDVRKGAVVYMSGEGRGGLGLRLRAMRAGWKAKGHTPDLADLHILPEAVQLRERDQVDEVCRQIELLDKQIALVVLDPLVRFTIGIDENSSGEMGQGIDVIDRIGHRFGCARVIVHHSLKSAKNVERGSSALRGAADAMYCLQDEGHGRIRLLCDKAKDFEAPEPIDLALRTVKFADGTSSCHVDLVVDHAEFMAKAAGLAVLGVLRKSGDWMPLQKIKAACPAKSLRTVERQLAGLIDAKAVMRRMNGRTVEYRIASKSGGTT